MGKISRFIKSKIWFLVGTILFIFSGVRYLNADYTLISILYFVVALVFLLGFILRIVQDKKNKPKDKPKKKLKKKPKEQTTNLGDGTI